jgi:hypothetical protein
MSVILKVEAGDAEVALGEIVHEELPVYGVIPFHIQIFPFVGHGVGETYVAVVDQEVEDSCSMMGTHEAVGVVIHP